MVRVWLPTEMRCISQNLNKSTEDLEAVEGEIAPTDE